MDAIGQRKQDHLELAAKGAVGFRQKTTLLECVHLIHDCLPELHLDDVDLTTVCLGKRLQAPLLLAGMTGGTEEAGEINRTLAAIAEERGYAFGLGSQRPMLQSLAATASYRVRDVAPEVLLLGNIGGVQAAKASPEDLLRLSSEVGLDALCVHLNPAMEVVQNEGDRDFRGVAQCLRSLCADYPVPIVAKETGCGISGGAALRLAAAGVRHVDVSGAGGTSWVGVETLRARTATRTLGERFWDWGLPTAVSLLMVKPAGFRTVFATGGIGNGLDAVRALRLGASAAGIARPVLQALKRGGRKEVERYLEQVELEMRTAFLLAGASSIDQLRSKPIHVEGALRDWQGSCEVAWGADAPKAT